jgi:hypothetical protein
MSLNFALCCVLAACVAAHGQSTGATLTGRVDDPAGRSVEGVGIRLIFTDRNQETFVRTDTEGRFRFAYVAPGNYRLAIADPGFAPTQVDLTVRAGQALDIPVRLTIAAVSQTVEVTAPVPLVEAARTQVSETVLPREVDSLPLNGRNYLDLALLAPGVSRTNTGAPQQFAETSAAPGTGISIAGQRNLNNNFLVDGLSANDDAAGLAGTFYSQEVIREFQVITSGGVAEFGRASGGVINITTKSGTNDWHGRLYGFGRNQRFDARNPLASSKGPLTQAQYGSSLGGPVVHNRTFIFSNFEQTRQNRAGLITIAPANADAINAALNSFRYAGWPITTGEFPTGYDTTNFFARVDHRLNVANQLAVRYSIYDVNSPNARSVGGLNAISRGTSLEDRDQTLALNEIATLSPRVLNEARVQFTRSRLAAPVNDPNGPAITISGVANLGTSTGAPTGRNTSMAEASDALSIQAGKHFVKTGFDYLYNRVDILFPGAMQGVYTFQNLAAFQAGRYITFQQAFGAPNQLQSNPNLGWFVQDEWRPAASLTVQAGLRIDSERLQEPIHGNTTAAPRFGIAWSPADRKTVVRASFGLYFDRLPLRALSNALQRDGSKYQVATLSFGQAGAPVFPGILAAFPPGQTICITTMDPRIRDSSTQQSSLQVDRELSPSTSISLGFSHFRGEHLILSRNVNAPTLSAAQAIALAVPNLGRPDPRYGNIGRYEGSGDSYYNGMTVSLRHRAASWADVRVSYNYSKSIDDAGNFFFSTPQNNFDLRDDRGLSDNDQRHRLTVSSVLSFKGWQLASIFSYASALPFNIQTGSDRNFDTAINDRPYGVGRNTGRGFNFTSLDIRLSRTFRMTERFRIEAMAESFNVLNRVNWQLPNNIFGTGTTPLPAFGQATAAGDPRQLQLGLRVGF